MLEDKPEDQDEGAVYLTVAEEKDDHVKTILIAGELLHEQLKAWARCSDTGKFLAVFLLSVCRPSYMNLHRLINLLYILYCQFHKSVCLLRGARRSMFATPLKCRKPSELQNCSVPKDIAYV